jgi:hypothetical protein
VHTDDNHLQAAICALRHLSTQDANACTDIDRSLWYDVIEELHERHETVCRRRASGKRGERSHCEGDRSNIEGDRSNLGGDRGKSFHAVAT